MNCILCGDTGVRGMVSSADGGCVKAACECRREGMARRLDDIRRRLAEAGKDTTTVTFCGEPIDGMSREDLVLVLAWSMYERGQDQERQNETTSFYRTALKAKGAFP